MRYIQRMDSKRRQYFAVAASERQRCLFEFHPKIISYVGGHFYKQSIELYRVFQFCLILFKRILKQIVPIKMKRILFQSNLRKMKHFTCTIAGVNF